MVFEWLDRRREFEALGGALHSSFVFMQFGYIISSCISLLFIEWLDRRREFDALDGWATSALG